MDAEVKLLELLKAHYEENNFSLFYDNPDLYWKTREVLGMRICSLRQCSGEGITSNGYDEYFCECMTETEQYAYQEKEREKERNNL